MTYAKNTQVTSAKSRVAIERLLEQYKASRTGVITEDGRASVGFTIGDWSVLFKMQLPRRDEPRFHARRRNTRIAEQRWEQACRSAWRALLLTIKAKLVAVESGVETFEQAFLAHLVIPGGRGATVGEREIPQLRAQNIEALRLEAGEIQ